MLLYKRLESGRFQWPSTPEEVRQLSQQEVRWLLEGLAIEQPKAVKQINLFDEAEQEAKKSAPELEAQMVKEHKLHTDAYAGYEKVENITRCLCWSHVRREFVDALPENLADESKTLCKAGIEQINELFAIEKELETLGQQERKKQRLEREKAGLAAFWSWIEINKGRVLPKSKLSKAMAYAQNHKKELENYC